MFFVLCFFIFLIVYNFYSSIPFFTSSYISSHTPFYFNNPNHILRPDLNYDLVNNYLFHPSFANFSFDHFSFNPSRPLCLNSNDLADSVRVRFAPSPTGLLHLGSLRVYLYNYMFAKSMNGRIVLRIDDTDANRCNKIFLNDILYNIRWLGLLWDEGPNIPGFNVSFLQSQRNVIYRDYAYKLVQQGKAYHCFCSKDIINDKRNKAINNGLKYRYDGTCRGLSLSDIHAQLQIDRDHVIRLKSNNNDDFIILRSNGIPTYNFSSCVDDYLMKITHIIRGTDHINNTPRQIEILKSLGANIPEYIHCSLILNTDQSKLSKRSDNNMSVTQMRLDGISPSTIINYTLFLGTKYSDDCTIYDINDLKSLFKIEFISKTSIMLNYDKLLWLNKCYINKLSSIEFAMNMKSYMEDIKFNDFKIDESALSESFKYVREHISLFKDYLNLIKNISTYRIERIKDYFTSYDGNEIMELIKLMDRNDNELYENVIELVNNCKPSSRRIYRLLLTGYEVGIPLVHIIQMWKILENNSTVNIVSLRDRINTLYHLVN